MQAGADKAGLMKRISVGRLDNTEGGSPSNTLCSSNIDKKGHFELCLEIKR